MSKKIDYLRITPCGECCAGCQKKAASLCHGCLETGGHCEEWAASGICPAFSCAKAHGILFCGLCPEFPCDHLPMMKWRPDCIHELTELAESFHKQSHP